VSDRSQSRTGCAKCAAEECGEREEAEESAAEGEGECEDGGRAGGRSRTRALSADRVARRPARRLRRHDDEHAALHSPPARDPPDTAASAARRTGPSPPASLACCAYSDYSAYRTYSECSFRCRGRGSEGPFRADHPAPGPAALLEGGPQGVPPHVPGGTSDGTHCEEGDGASGQRVPSARGNERAVPPALLLQGPGVLCEPGGVRAFAVAARWRGRGSGQGGSEGECRECRGQCDRRKWECGVAAAANEPLRLVRVRFRSAVVCRSARRRARDAALSGAAAQTVPTGAAGRKRAAPRCRIPAADAARSAGRPDAPPS